MAAWLVASLSRMQLYCTNRVPIITKTMTAHKHLSWMVNGKTRRETCTRGRRTRATTLPANPARLLHVWVVDQAPDDASLPQLQGL